MVFGRADGQLLGFYHPPALALGRAPAVVLCNPLGYEAMSAHRTLRHLAERLADAGFPALRFDYQGTGDSAGHSGDPDRIATWIGDIRSAIRELRDLSGVREIALFGVRFGASLAMLAASGEPGVDALVAWAPVVSGRVFARELRAFRMLTDPTVKRPDGGEEVGGYLFTRQTLAEMSAIDLLARTDPGVGSLLVVPRGEVPSRDEHDLVAHWKASGAVTTLASESGYAPMMRDDPYEAVVPSATLDAIVAWLGRMPGTSMPRHASPATPASAVLNVTGVDSKLLRETAILFGEDQRLFGVITEPRGPLSGDRPAVLLLNVGADSHVGPHRMNVQHARDLASMGYLTFRLDVGGLGESLAAPGRRENQLYDVTSVDDVRCAMSALAETRGVQRFVVVGLCSGAFLAYHTAVSDTRIVGQVLLNMFAFEWKEGDPVAPAKRNTYLSSRFYARSLLDRSAWRRAIHGEVDVAGIATVVAGRLRDSILADTRELGFRVLGRRAHTPVERAFHAICDRGVRSLMVFSDEDGGLDMVTRYLGTDARRMSSREEFSIEVASRVGHTFTSLTSQRRLQEIVARYLTAHFAWSSHGAVSSRPGPSVRPGSSAG